MRGTAGYGTSACPCIESIGQGQRRCLRPALPDTTGCRVGGPVPAPLAANPLDIAHEQLWPGQTVNHFKNAQCLTTKHGLCHTVREMVWWEAADAAAFYPR